MRLAPSGGLGQYTGGFLRGGNSAHTLVLLDGVPINDPSSPSNGFDFGQDLLGAVERIEVVRGPASSLYGSSALGGVVNIVTRKAPADRTFAPFGDLAGGTQRTLRGALGATGTVGQFDYLVGSQGLTTQGFSNLAPRLQTNTREAHGFRGAATSARLGWTPAEGTRVEGLLRWQQNRFGQDGLNDNFQLATDPNYRAQDQRITGQVRAETRLLNGAWTTGLRGFDTESRRRYLNLPNAGASADYSTTNDLNRGRRQGLEWSNTLRLPGFGPAQDGALAFGVLHALEQTNSRAGYTDYTTVTRAQQHSTGGHASLQYRLWERLDLTGGLREEATSGFAEATTWRAGAVLAVPELNSRIRASGGTAYRTPSLYERFGQAPGYIGNATLRPERSLGWEVGTETDITAGGKPNFATAGWTFFRSNVRSLINYSAVNAFTFTQANIDRANIHGAELGLTLRPFTWAEGTAAWTLTEAFDATTHQRLPRRPEHVLSVAGRVQPLERLVVAPTVLFTGRSPEGAFASYANTGDANSTPHNNRAGAVLNLTATYRLLPEVAIFVEGRNLTNSRWEPINGFATPGRSFLFGTRFAL
jgi:vitamin B12 transporter